jgi:hypothetical protein
MSHEQPSAPDFRFMTPIGRLSRAYINVPDPASNFAFSAELEFGDEAADLMERYLRELGRVLCGHRGSSRLPIYRSAKGIRRFQFVAIMGRPDIVDAQCSRVPSWVQVRCGSHVILAATPIGDEGELRLLFNAVQVVTLARSRAYEFTPIPGGFVFGASPII